MRNIQNDLYKNIHSSLTHNSLKLKQSKCSSIEELMEKNHGIFIQRNVLLMYATI